MSGFKYPEGSRVTLIDADSFQVFVETHEHVFIHFGATWNGVDQMLIPAVSEAAKKLLGKISFAVLDVDLKKNFNLCQAHKLYNVPYVEYYERGKLKEAYVGYDFKKAFNKIQSTTGLLQRLLNEFGESR